AGLEIKLPAGFGLMSDFNYQKGEEELDNGTTSPSRHAAPWFGITRFIYKNNGINLQLYGTYQGKYDFDDLAKEEQGKTEIYALDKNGNPYAPGWFTLNFKGMVRLTDNLSVSVGLENLTDKRYRPYSSGICAPGRNFIISLRTNF
ncbi:MAG: TonB-dependent receptor, partial [Calditrichaceae bacterium]